MLNLCVAHNMELSQWPEIRFTQSARKHRIGRSSARYVMAHYKALEVLHDGILKLEWVGKDERGRELEIIAIHIGDVLLVKHVMPRRYRNRKKGGWK